MTRLPEVRMSGLCYDIATLEPPWALRCRAEEFAQIVIVRRGSCWFECPTFSPHPFYVAEGGMIVTVGGGIQTWRNASDTPVREGAAGFPSVPLGQFQRDPADARKTELLIGRSPRSANLLIPAFPRAFYVSPAEQETMGRIRTMLDLIDLETHGGEDLIESDGVISRAAEIMTIVLARYVKRQLAEENPHWPEMATDVQVMRALQLIETRPAKNWTVESLAAEIGMGRSAFAVRFKTLVGDTPMNCLTRCRMQIASTAIRDGKRSIAAIANSSGYLSEPAFIKAFRRYFGMTPGRYRASVTGRLTESAAPVRPSGAARAEQENGPTPAGQSQGPTQSQGQGQSQGQSQSQSQSQGQGQGQGQSQSQIQSQIQSQSQSQIQSQRGGERRDVGVHEQQRSQGGGQAEVVRPLPPRRAWPEEPSHAAYAPS